MSGEVMALPGRALRDSTPRTAAPRSPAFPTRRFTIDGSEALESHLASICRKILAGIRGLVPPHTFEALLLGGGYGRGEGGVWRTPEGDRPYNDLEFYVCLRGNRHLNELLYHRPLEVLGEILTPIAGIEVEFKITSLAEFKSQATSMFSYDLALGHQQLWGPSGVLTDCPHHAVAGQIPLSEATRLLMNRCSGLLLAREKLQHPAFGPANADFVRRNLAKAELAFGDAILAVHGLYHWSCRKRSRRLQQLAAADHPPWLAEVRSRHPHGVAFKLHPERTTATREGLLQQHTEVTALGGEIWLWLEGRRLGFPFVSFASYAEYEREKCAGTNSWRNLLVNLKATGPMALLRARRTRHPRERVLDALTLLLWEPTLFDRPNLLARVQTALNTKAANFPSMVAAYRALWSRVN